MVESPAREKGGGDHDIEYKPLPLYYESYDAVDAMLRSRGLKPTLARRAKTKVSSGEYSDWFQSD